MNDSADQLLEELGGLGSVHGAGPAAGKAVNQAGAHLHSEEEKDHWRILLVDLVYLLNASFRDAHYWEGVKAEKDTFKQLVDILQDLSRMPSNDGRIRIVYRGSQSAKVDSKADYVIRFGDLNVDATATAAVIKRKGIRLKHIEGRLIKAFEVLSSQGIETIFLKIPGSSDDELERMKICLRIISRHKKAVSDDVPIEFNTAAGKRSVMPILNEAQQPDPNLTMLAALNDLGPANMQEMVQKVSALMDRPESAHAGIRSVNVYKTIFNIKSLRQKLARPPIEVNSERPSQTGAAPQATAGTAGGGGRPGGLSSGAGQIGHGGQSRRGAGGVDAGGGGQGTSIVHDGEGSGSETVVQNGGHGGEPVLTAPMDPAVLKAGIAKFVKETYGDSPETGVQVMRTIFTNDYSQLEMAGLEKRLALLTDLLSSLQKSDSSQEFSQQLIQKIQVGVDQIPTEVLDDVVVQDDVIKIWDGEDEKVVTIRKKLLTSFELDGSDESVFPIRFLLALEREVHMFLALVGGNTAAAVIRSALKVYGNPAAKIYQLEAGRQYLSSLLQHLAVLIRGLGRIGQQKDFDLLDKIGKQQQVLTDLSDEPRHAAQVRRTMG
jgi:hypothetical protein